VRNAKIFKSVHHAMTEARSDVHRNNRASRAHISTTISTVTGAEDDFRAIVAASAARGTVVEIEAAASAGATITAASFNSATGAAGVRIFRRRP
jgi:hypothetical protein